MKSKKFLLLHSFIVFLLLSGCSTKQDFLPESNAGLELYKSYTGKEAKNMLDKLHFLDVADGDSKIGFYRSSRGSASVYATIFADGKKAESKFEDMKNKISGGNSIYNSGKMIELNSINIFRCKGLGQTHYTFAVGNTMVWISCDDDPAPEFLQDYLNKIL